MRSRSIAWRLALAFAMVCALVLGAIGVFLYRSLAAEIAYRDDLALLGRLEQVRALLAEKQPSLRMTLPAEIAALEAEREAVLAAVAFDERVRHSEDRLRLRAEESRRVHFLLELRGVRRRDNRVKFTSMPRRFRMPVSGS